MGVWKCTKPLALVQLRHKCGSGQWGSECKGRRDDGHPPADFTPLGSWKIWHTPSLPTAPVGVEILFLWHYLISDLSSAKAVSITCPWARHIVTLTFSRRPQFPNNTTLSLSVYVTAWWANSFITAKSFLRLDKKVSTGKEQITQTCVSLLSRDRRLKVKSVSETVGPNISWHFRFKGKTFDNVLNFCELPLTLWKW